jgi:hypothetical protein
MSELTDQPSLFPDLSRGPLLLSEEWRQAFYARRRKAHLETPNPYHRAHYEQLRRNSEAA